MVFRLKWNTADSLLVHLEGTLEPELLFKFAKRNNITIRFSSEGEVKNAYSSLTNLESFLALYYEGAKVEFSKLPYLLY